jgi:hypothetical protein
MGGKVAGPCPLLQAHFPQIARGGRVCGSVPTFRRKVRGGGFRAQRAGKPRRGGPRRLTPANPTNPRIPTRARGGEAADTLSWSIWVRSALTTRMASEGSLPDSAVARHTRAAKMSTCRQVAVPCSEAKQRHLIGGTRRVAHGASSAQSATRRKTRCLHSMGCAQFRDTCAARGREALNLVYQNAHKDIRVVQQVLKDSHTRRGRWREGRSASRVVEQAIREAI